jgi:ribosomal protein S18 acetylase RimI-like enzyme
VGGAAWFRFTAAIPEVTIGVQELWRGIGVGTRLLTELHAAARRAGITQLSLSVEHDNRALFLYERLGYVVHLRDGGAATLVVQLEQP